MFEVLTGSEIQYKPEGRQMGPKKRLSGNPLEEVAANLGAPLFNGFGPRAA